MNEENLIVLDVPLNFGMEILDKSKFEYDLEFTGIAVPCAMVGEYLKSLKSHLHKYARMKRAVPCEEDETMKLLLLDPNVDLNVLPGRVKDYIAEGTFKIVENVKIRIDFDYWSAEEILGAILPKDLEFGASFEQVGHLAHFNLRDELLPYKNIIGQVVLEKNRATLRTVVNKIGKIESVFRTFPMEVIAGEEDFDVEVKESNCRFRFDFSKTYWNSRLHHEHESLVKTFNKGEWICDVFAGVGPFVLPALKRGCNVLANDLNPNSITYMKNNIKLNKLSNANVQIFNMDGRDFIKQVFSSFSERIDHVILNLPATAIEFLDAFQDTSQFTTLPKRIHCYCFANEEDAENYLLQIANERIGKKVTDYELKHVRKVAPNKEMYRLSFSLPEK